MAVTIRPLHVGSPARAGIDPGVFPLSGSYEGFPRTGGDRPVYSLIDTALREVPPHGRG